MDRITQRLLDECLQSFLRECKKSGLPVDGQFAAMYIQLLAYDQHDGLNVRTAILSVCKREAFVERALSKYANPADPTLCCLKLNQRFHRSSGLRIEDYAKSYEEQFKVQLRALTDDILRYPESSSKKQIEDMFFKMQVFIIASYNIGSPKNHVLLNLTGESLKSVLGPSDLHKYVLTKRYHRLEYLQRLSATVAGIIIYNNQAPFGDKENFRQIFKDLEMAIMNTRDNLDRRVKDMEEQKTRGYQLIDSIIEINIPESKVICHYPVEHVMTINHYVILFTVYERQLKELKESFERTKFLIQQAAKNMDCVVNKINDLLKGRSAVESEVIFPHFVFLAGVWQSAISYLNHLAELNRIKESLDEYVTPELEAAFAQKVQIAARKTGDMHLNKEVPFPEIMERNKEQLTTDLRLPNVPNLMEYCSMMITFTNGLLLPATLHRQLCENDRMQFGFQRVDYLKYAQVHYEDFSAALRNVIFSSTDLIVLFNLEEHVMKHYEKVRCVKPKRAATCGTQTEMVVTNDLSAGNRINVTWNAWDFHRETIKLADLRKRQTHSTQTWLSYGQRNAQNETHFARDNK